MKVLVVDQFAHLGGGQMCLLDLLPAFRNKGWQVHAALPCAGPFAHRLISNNASVDFFDARPYRDGRKSVKDMFRFPFDILAQARRFAALLDRYKPDLIYVNGPRVLPAATLAAKKVPLLFHAHSHVNHAAARTVVASCMRARPAAVVACSQSVGTQYSKNLASRNLTVVPNGVPDCGYREPSDRPLLNPRIGIIGRIAPGKGHLQFVQGAKLLTARIPGSRFVICGGLSDAHPRYGAKVLQAGHDLPIDWMDWRPDIENVLRDLDILVIPSAVEGLPRVMLEAFSAGVPVVAFPAGGITEAIRDGDTGFLVPQRSPAGLAETLERVLTTEGALQLVSRNARHKWELTYNVQRYASDVMAVIDGVLEQ